MQRLGKNTGGYHGETIDIQGVLRQIEQACATHGWMCERIGSTNGEPLQGNGFLACRRVTPVEGKRIYISTGIHGDEPAGPLAALELIQCDAWPADAAVWLCPCLNPAGFALNRREHPEGIDLNRDYRQPQSAQTRAHIEWLDRQPAFDIALCLHEDWEAAGFYLYELNLDGRVSLAETIISRVGEVCPIDTAPQIEGRPAQNGIIRPDFNFSTRPQWPEAIYLLSNKTRLTYTFESPSDYPLNVRVKALAVAAQTAVDSLY